MQARRALLVIGVIVVGTAAVLWQRRANEQPTASPSVVVPMAERAKASPVPTPPDAGAADVGVTGTCDPPPRLKPRAAALPVEPLQHARALLTSNPRKALELLQDMPELSRNDPRAPEAAWIKVKALVNLERIGDARVEAEDFFNRFPNDPRQLQIESLTGAHPRPVGPGRGIPRR